MSIHEEYGEFGVFAPQPADVAKIVYYGLYALQHRGQESCGIVVNDDSVFASHKDLGLVGEVFSELSCLPQGTMAVGHTRYGTTGATNHRTKERLTGTLLRRLLYRPLSDGHPCRQRKRSL